MLDRCSRFVSANARQAGGKTAVGRDEENRESCVDNREGCYGENADVDDSVVQRKHENDGDAASDHGDEEAYEWCEGLKRKEVYYYFRYR